MGYIHPQTGRYHHSCGSGTGTGTGDYYSGGNYQQPTKEEQAKHIQNILEYHGIIESDISKMSPEEFTQYKERLLIRQAHENSCILIGIWWFISVMILVTIICFFCDATTKTFTTAIMIAGVIGLVGGIGFGRPDSD